MKTKTRPVEKEKLILVTGANGYVGGKLLANSGITTLEFRASIIIGVGSISFEMIRTLVEKLPVMVTPRWIRTEAQPIAIEDVIGYLLEAIEVPLEKKLDLRDWRS